MPTHVKRKGKTSKKISWKGRGKRTGERSARFLPYPWTINFDEPMWTFFAEFLLVHTVNKILVLAVANMADTVDSKSL